MSPPRLEALGITKRFPGVRALHRVDLSVGPGEVLAVIGENGAGKSTLMKILAGIQAPDAGEIAMDGRPVVIGSTRVAMDLGIALIHQELNLADNLDAGANIFLGREPRRHGLVDGARIEAASLDVLDQVGADFPPTTVLSTLSTGRQQLVEIAKALSLDASVLIMDEPTSSLSAREAERLFEVVRGLSAKGVSVVYISHRLGEVQELAHRVVVLRDGENAGELARDEIEHDAMVRMMVGRDLSVADGRRARDDRRPVLEVERLVTPAHPTHEVSLRVDAGEIVGIAGLVGAGRSELLRTLFGVDRALAGRVRLDGVEVRLESPREAIRAGVALVPEDRQGQGLFVEQGVRENVGIAALWRHQRAGFVDSAGERRTATDMIERLAIKTPDEESLVQTLSGGNQQKVVLAKWLALDPRLLLLDEPTRGIDVGARHEIYRLMVELAERGIGILFASSEMEEILAMSDRALVMHEGRLAGELSRDELGEEAVMRLATGGSTEAA